MNFSLMTPDEVRLLDNDYAILFIRGERPVKDLKYDILKHPNVDLTADGSGGFYRHGEVKDDVASIQLESFDVSWLEKSESFETSYELKSSEDLKQAMNSNQARSLKKNY